MTTYFEYKVRLSDGQKAKLSKAIKNSSPNTLRLSKDELAGSDELMLTRSQINKITKAIQNKSGVEIKISKTQIRKAVKHGGSLWSSLISIGTKMLPIVTKGAAKIAPPLATGALSALESLGIDKLSSIGAARQCGFRGPSQPASLPSAGWDGPLNPALACGTYTSSMCNLLLNHVRYP